MDAFRNRFREKVLVVDDKEINRAILGNILEKLTELKSIRDE